MSNTCKMFHNLHMLWMIIWIYPHHIAIHHFTSRGAQCNNAVVEAIDPFKIALASMSNTYKEFHYIHML